MVSGTSFQETRDNINVSDTTKDLVLIGVLSEKIVVEECSTVLTSNDVGDSFVLGLDTNDILGTTELGVNNYGDTVIQNVTNPNNTFKERFRFNTLHDSTNSTATFDTTYYNVHFNQSQHWITNYIFKNNQNVSDVLISVLLKGGDTEFLATDSEFEPVKTITIGQ